MQSRWASSLLHLPNAGIFRTVLIKDTKGLVQRNYGVAVAGWESGNEY